MAWVEALQGQIVALDTAPLIYFIEDHPKYAGAVGPFFESLASGNFQAITSVITLLEVLVHPLRNNNPTLAARYRELLLHTEGLSIMPLDSEIAEESARLRAIHGIRTPDAVQLATAARGSASFILTNDSNLPALSGMQVLILDQLL